ncbi:MAG: beta-lactamase family protein [Sphingomonas sp.]|nr:beta-lactamase family protein [Sphingomonas sp.]
MVARTPAVATSQACKATDAELLAAIRSVHDKQKNVGVQAAIHLNGRTVFSKGYGLADRDSKVPVTRDTVFPVASITKAFTGVATLKAHAAGNIDLDKPIQGYVPEFPVKPELAVTPRRLAAHRAGIRHWGPEREALFLRHFERLNQILPSFKDDPLRAQAGAEYQYSSYGYNLLGLAVERVTGVPFTDYVWRQILQPLGLSHTRFDDARRPAATTKLYSFYDLKTYADLPEAIPVPLMDYSHNMAGGNMSTTSEDLVKFGAALFRPGFLPRSQYDLLFSQPTFGGEASPMTFGFFTQEAGAERRLSISGSNPGFQAGLMIYPDRRVAVAVLSNTWGVGSRSGDMVNALPKQLADLCAPVAPPAASAG